MKKMNNKERITEALVGWLTETAASLLPQLKIPANGVVARVMTGLFDIDLASYNIWDELGFLLTPTVCTFVEPHIERYLAAVPDERIGTVALSYADAFLARAREKGSVNLFGVQLDETDILNLRTRIEAALQTSEKND